MTEISEDTVRADVRAWLEANWSPDYGLVEWRLKLAESGWGVPHWPSRWYGHDLPVGLVPAVEEEFKRLGAIGVAKVGIRTLAAATILEHALGVQEAADVLRTAVARGNGRRACDCAAVPIEIVQRCPLFGSGLPGRRTGVGPDPLLRN